MLNNVKKTIPYKNDKYLEFVHWFALPINAKIDEHGCKTQAQFAQKYEISSITLSRWKKRDDFKNRVEAKRFDWGKENTGNVFAGWLNACMKGNPYAIELWLNYFENWNKKQVLENRVPEFTNDDLLKLIEVLPKKDQQNFYDTVNQIILRARDERERLENDLNYNLKAGE